jgi:uncharacterized repeat protein (TIGR01451 family)
MRRSILWMLPASLALLALLVAPMLGTPTSAAPRSNLTPVTEPPTQTPVPPTDTPTTPVPPTDTPTTPVATSTTPGTSPTETQVSVVTETATPTRERQRDEDDDDEPTPTADLALSKQADRSSAAVGDIVSYTITVINRGATTARDVSVVDNLPDVLDVVDVAATRGSVSQDGRRISVSIGEMAPGEAVTVVVRAQINGTAAAGDVANGAVLVIGPEATPQLQTTAVVALAAAQPTPTLPPRSAPLPRTPQNTRLPRTGDDMPSMFEVVLLVAMAAGALFCLSMAARSFRRR